MNSPILPRISVSSGVHMWPRTENGPHFPSGQKYIYPTRTQYWNDTEITQIAPTKKCCFLYWNIKQKLTWTVYREWFGLTLHDSLHDSSKLLLRFNWFESTWLAVFFCVWTDNQVAVDFCPLFWRISVFCGIHVNPQKQHNSIIFLISQLWCILAAVLYLFAEGVSAGHCSVCWLLNVPATWECISGTDLHRQFMCCHTEIEVADPTFHLTQSRYTDTGPTSPITDPITPGAWQGSHWSANF